MADNDFPSEFLIVEEVAGRFRKSVQQVRDEVQQGRFPVRPIRAGRRLLFPRAEVDEYFAGLLAAR